MGQEPAERQIKKSFAAVLYEILKSRKLAFFLIIALATAILAASLIPQTSQFATPEIGSLRSRQPELFSFLKVTGLVDIYNSWWFYTLLALFFLNTLVCTISRVKYTLNKNRKWSDTPSKSQKSRLCATTPIFLKTSPDKALDITKTILSAKRYRVINKSGFIAAKKNWWSNWSTIILHTSFLVIALGILIGRATFMSGQVNLVEGQRFFDEPGNYLHSEKGPFFNENYAGFEIILKNFTDKFWRDGTNKEYASTINIYNNGQYICTKTISPNYPASYKGRNIYQLSLFGCSAILRLDKAGGPSKFGWINFETPKTANTPIENKFVMRGTNYQADAKFYPDYKDRGTQKSWNLYKLKDPVLTLKILDTSTNGVYEGIMRPGQSVRLGDETLTFVTARHWTALGVTKDSGAWIVFLGFWMALTGIAMLYFIIPKQIWVLVDEAEDGTVLYLTGTASKYRISFAERLNELREEIADALSNQEEVIEHVTV